METDCYPSKDSGPEILVIYVLFWICRFSWVCGPSYSTEVIFGLDVEGSILHLFFFGSRSKHIRKLYINTHENLHFEPKKTKLMVETIFLLEQVSAMNQRRWFFFNISTGGKPIKKNLTSNIYDLSTKKHCLITWHKFLATLCHVVSCCITSQHQVKSYAPKHPKPPVLQSSHIILGGSSQLVSG